MESVLLSQQYGRGALNALNGCCAYFVWKHWGILSYFGGLLVVKVASVPSDTLYKQALFTLLRRGPSLWQSNPTTFYHFMVYFELCSFFILQWLYPS